MSSLRLAGIPIDHIAAETIVFPLASESALAHHPTRLDPTLEGATGNLWRDAERHLLACFPAFSLDELIAVRDRFWFACGETAPTTLEAYLRNLADFLLETDGAVAIPRLHQTERMDGASHAAHAAIARRSWLWFSFAFPQDYLLAALGTGSVSPERLDLLSPGLDRHLRDNGYAETHLHVGAALDFPLLWTFLLHKIADKSFDENAFTAPGAGFEEGRKLAHWVLRAALARYLLAAFLAWPYQGKSFRDYLRTEARYRIRSELGETNHALLIQGLAELQSGRLRNGESIFVWLKAIYARLSRAHVSRWPQNLQEARAADPVNSLLRGTPAGGYSPEARWLRAGLDYLDHRALHGQPDREFAELFWQIVRVRALFHRHIVQRPMTPGLSWFIRFYSRSGPARRGLPLQVLFESAAELGGAGRGLRSLEIRTSPPETVNEVLSYVKQVNKVAVNWRQGRPPAKGKSAHIHSVELGLVYHFVKQREPGNDKGRPGAHWHGTHANPGNFKTNSTGYRYASFYKELRAEAMALAWLLRHFPLSLRVVRGIDVCNDERGVPSWVMVPLLSRVREAAREGAAALRRCGLPAPPRLRTTIHAGEDFVHLLTGLRSVDEAIEQLHLCEGDRIGHGVALGVDPQQWASRAGRIPMLTEERLFDLVWEWVWYGKQAGSGLKYRRAMLDREIAHLSEAMFGRTVSPVEMESLQTSLANPCRMCQAGFPDGCASEDRSFSTAGLLRMFLTDISTFRRGRRIIWVDPTHEAETLIEIQSGLRRKVGARGLTVEVNPISNLLIGDLGDLAAHPLWRLRPPRGGGDAPPVSICVGSDDPLVFASNLRQEYQFLNDALTLAGLSNEESRIWLDQTRVCGLASRFTLERTDQHGVSAFMNTQTSNQRYPF